MAWKAHSVSASGGVGAGPLSWDSAPFVGIPFMGHSRPSWLATIGGAMTQSNNQPSLYSPHSVSLCKGAPVVGLCTLCGNSWSWTTLNVGNGRQRGGKAYNHQTQSPLCLFFFLHLCHGAPDVGLCGARMPMMKIFVLAVCCHWSAQRWLHINQMTLNFLLSVLVAYL